MSNKFCASVRDYRIFNPFIVITADPIQADTFLITNSCYSVKVNPVLDENAYILCHLTATFVWEEANSSSSPTSLQLKWEMDKSEAEKMMKDDQLKKLVDFANTSLLAKPSSASRGEILNLLVQGSKSLTKRFECSKLPDHSVVLDAKEDIVINRFTIGIKHVSYMPGTDLSGTCEYGRWPPISQAGFRCRGTFILLHYVESPVQK